MWTVVEGEPRKHGGVYKWTEAGVDPCHKSCKMSNLSHGPNHLVLAKYATPHSAVAKDRQEVREWRIVKESTVMRIVRETREERQKK